MKKYLIICGIMFFAITTIALAQSRGTSFPGNIRSSGRDRAGVTNRQEAIRQERSRQGSIQSQSPESGGNEVEFFLYGRTSQSTGQKPQTYSHSKKEDSGMGNSKEKDDVTLVVDGMGADKTEAIQNALRNAIEQAYGTFVSSNTSLLDDEIVRDEIATVSSGNIKSFKELSSSVLSDGKVSITLSADLSIGRLVSYAKSKGASAEFAGQAFMMQMKMRELNKKNELSALFNLMERLKASNPIYDYSVTIGEPKEDDSLGTSYSIPISVALSPNDNYIVFEQSIRGTLSSLSLGIVERKEYDRNYTPYTIFAFCEDIRLSPNNMYNKQSFSTYFFRNDQSTIQNILSYLAEILTSELYSFELFEKYVDGSDNKIEINKKLVAMADYDHDYELYGNHDPQDDSFSGADTGRVWRIDYYYNYCHIPYELRVLFNPNRVITIDDTIHLSAAQLSRLSGIEVVPTSR